MRIQRLLLVACLLCGLVVLGAKLKSTSPAPPVTVEKSFKSKPLPAVPSTPSAATLRVAAPVATLTATMKSQPRTMKLLLITAVETEPSYLALRSFLDTLSIPYEVFIAAKSGAVLPQLSDSTTGKGNYQGILLATGNLAVCDTTPCRSALAPDGWTALDNYSRDFAVRTVSYYTYPEARYGIAANGFVNTDVTPASIAFTPAAATIFPYLNRANPLTLRYAYAHLATPSPATGETTTPILTINGATAGVLHTKADGREYMALTFDNNPYLLHSQALNYGILNWVTGGVFIGSRKIYMTPQVDDHFLANDQYVDNIAACKPPGFQLDPTVDPTENCPTVRIASADLRTLANWQASWNSKPQFANFRVSHAYNGFGTTTAGGGGPQDSLVLETQNQRNAFIWINHTWDHENLDCFNPVPNSGNCPSATYDQSLQELTPNIALAPQLGLAFDSTAMVTPNISGLLNPEFLRAAVSKGIKYLVSDSSQPAYLPATPNTGIRNQYQPSILMIPRRPTNIYYNTSSGLNGAIGSLPDEYNYFYGPNGIFRIGGPGGPPFFSTVQTYNDIVQRESDNLLSYMLQYEMYPQMYHQSNLLRYSGNKSLLSDVIDAAFTKFSRISNLPVLSMAQTALGQEIESRMNWLGAGVEGTLTPGVGISLKASKAADVPVTGVWASKCETYGGQKISKVTVGGGPAVVSLNASGACPASASVFPKGGTPTGIPPTATLGPVAASSSADFNKTAIAQKSVIWFSAIIKLDAKKTDTLIEFRNAKIKLSNSSTPVEVPGGSVRFDPNAKAATTTYSGGRWETVVPVDFKDDVFITGIPVPVTTALPGGIKDVTWTADAYASGKVNVQWTWSAAVYSSFPADSTKILPKPVKGDKYTNYDKSHDAGTPEGALNFLIP
ncbi:MAG: hypothetical protein JNN08_32635, partial [Bryobacterales bacterium]|nr:hypothetical protein [Bryobacterales bacterium]